MKRILIVDDSQFICEVIRGSLRGIEDEAVIFVALNPLIAIRKANLFKIDICLLDYEMPYMNGLMLMRYLKEINPFTKFIMVSAFTEPGAQITLEALSQGAYDYVLKPSNGNFEEFKKEILEKVSSLLTVQRPAVAPRARKSTQKESVSVAKVEFGYLSSRVRESKLIAIGISTGGPPVLEKIFSNLRRDFEIPILVVQHMPPTFTKALADRLSRVCSRNVKEAEDGEKIEPYTIYIARGGAHLAVEKILGKFYLKVLENVEKVNNHKPSCDILFSSVAQACGRYSTGIIMTGMGSDGANGLLEMKNEGALTIAQSRESCVVFGMPRSAIEKGAVEAILSVEEIIDVLNLV